jgi:hypothetical protein
MGSARPLTERGERSYGRQDVRQPGSAGGAGVREALREEIPTEHQAQILNPAMQHLPAREAIPRAEVVGAEDLEGGERHVFFDLGGKECQRPPTGPKVLAIADILRSEPYQFQHRRRCASDNAGKVTDVKHRQTHRPRQLFPDDLFLDLKRPLNQTLPMGIDISFDLGPGPNGRIRGFRG